MQVFLLCGQVMLSKRPQHRIAGKLQHTFVYIDRAYLPSMVCTQVGKYVFRKNVSRNKECNTAVRVLISRCS